jgi:hypothetical protein
VQFVVGAGVRVLHRDVRTELDVFPQRLPERGVTRQAGSARTLA